ncbi:MAG TPA: PHP domain-containing protein, partial [Jiangellaceae bacterium]|nr:PHP domain-containing protein [Jiangellaceae bacterium]
MGWHNPPISWREFEQRLSWGSKVAPLWEDELRELDAQPIDPAAGTRLPWAELHCHTSYSFLDGASDPSTLVAEAVRLGVEILAVTDHDGMYGVVRMAEAAGEAGLGTVFGAELSLGLTARQTGVPDPEGHHLLVLARNADGYRRLAGAITTAQLRGEKGRPVYDLDELAGSHDGQWAILTGCRKGAVPAALAAGGPEAAAAELRRLADMFGRDHVFVELIDHDQPLDDARNDALYELAHRVGVGVVASNNVHYARPADTDLAQVLAAARARSSLDEMAGWLPANGTAHLRSGAEMAARLARFPGAHEATLDLARACAFDFAVIAPDLPERRVGEGHTDASWLRHEVERGARRRYGSRGPATEHIYAQIDHELEVIEELNFSGYFLIVYEIT